MIAVETKWFNEEENQHEAPTIKTLSIFKMAEKNIKKNTLSLWASNFVALILNTCQK